MDKKLYETNREKAKEITDEVVSYIEKNFANTGLDTKTDIFVIVLRIIQYGVEV